MRGILDPRRTIVHLGSRARSQLDMYRESRIRARVEQSLSKFSPEQIDSDRIRVISRCTDTHSVDVLRYVNEVRSDMVLQHHVKFCLSEFRRRGVTGVTPDVDCQTLYALVRALKPKIVVESGMYYGASAAFILSAMERNGMGTLHSIDLPSESADAFGTTFGLGCMVPLPVRHRWTVHWGDSRQLLLPLLQGLGEIEMFFHDSVHTYPFMMWEFTSAWSALTSGGVLASHDVWRHRVFDDFVSESAPSIVNADRIYNVGLVVRAR